MGIRIYKAIGYGLTDVAHADYEIVDSRINDESFLLGSDIPPVEDYIAFVERTTSDDDFDARLETGLLKHQTGESVDSSKLCIWKSEYGLPNVLLLQPFGCPEWRRYDSPIDYEEEAIRGLTMEYRAERLLGGIHPYEGYMDARTGERMTGERADLVRVWRQLVNAPLENGVSEADRTLVLDKVAQRMGLGFADHAEAERCIVPDVPDEIRRVCTWGELFTSPEVCFQLRPLLYTYWA